MNRHLILIFMVLSLCMGRTGVWAQGADADAKAGRERYLKENYGLTSGQIAAYEAVLADLERQDKAFKDRRISSKEYEKLRVALYKGYERQVAAIFTPRQYDEWCNVVRAHERYRVLSEERHVPKEQMYALHEAEQGWLEERAALWQGSEEKSVKHRLDRELLENFRNKVRAVLAADNGEWYISTKALTLGAQRNMDKYGATFREAYRIAEIEDLYARKRKDILAQKERHYSVKEERLLLNDEAREQAIRQALPADVAGRWVRISRSRLDYELGKLYGLDKSQITSYKEAYNAYAITEYSIIYEDKKLSADEKLEKLNEANRVFCEAVRPLFAADAYTKWEGWRKYSFERRMEQKSSKF